ncbi:MAG: sel1 repeat family protein [Proteobacteria bacterium]|nr:sel1 repeat family protein [Pseudomonadota bacterium]
MPSLRIATLLILCGSLAMPAHASLSDGLDALRKRDYATAAKELRPLAEKGDAEAQYRIGRMYEFGAGYPKDMAQAIAWYTKAGNQGHADAQQELGVIYALGDGVPKNDKLAATWFDRAADLGNATAQYNLGLMYAKGTGVPLDNAQAVGWWRKAAQQGEPNAQFKLGVAYQNGEGVAANPVLAYANYAVAARNGYKDAAAYRDDVGKALPPAQRQAAQAAADAWKPGQPMPTVIAGVPTAAAGPPHKDSCAASGKLGGQPFTATHCAIAMMGDQHSVDIWFNEAPLSPEDVDGFQLSSYAKADPGGKQRTLVQVMFCPGGGKTIANPAAVRTIDLNTNHAKSPLAGVQWSLEPKDFKVEKLSGELRPGGVLAGRITAARGSTTLALDFDLVLPAKDAAAGLTCN